MRILTPGCISVVALWDTELFAINLYRCKEQKSKLDHFYHSYYVLTGLTGLNGDVKRLNKLRTSVSVVEV